MGTLLPAATDVLLNYLITFELCSSMTESLAKISEFDLKWIKDLDRERLLGDRLLALRHSHTVSADNDWSVLCTV